MPKDKLNKQEILNLFDKFDYIVDSYITDGDNEKEFKKLVRVMEPIEPIGLDSVELKKRRTGPKSSKDFGRRRSRRRSRKSRRSRRRSRRSRR